MADHQASEETSQLVQRSRNGDAEAFGRLVARTHPTILSICVARLAHWDDAEDVAQDVFLRAWLDISALRDPARFDAWVATMARRLCINVSTAKRRRQRIVTMLPQDALARLPLEAPSQSPRQAAAHEEEVNQAHAAINSLPPAERELMTLHYEEGLSLSEIARLSGVETSTISRRLEKILGRLRTKTGQQGLALRRAAKRSPEATRRAAALASAFAMLPPALLNPIRGSLPPLAIPSPTSIGVLLMNGKNALIAAAAVILLGTATTVLLISPSARNTSASVKSGGRTEVLTLPTYNLGQMLEIVLKPGETLRIPHAPNAWAIQDLELAARADGGIDFKRTYVGNDQVESYVWGAPLPTELQLYYNLRPDSKALIMQAYLIESDAATGGTRIRYEARTSEELKTAWVDLEKAYSEGRIRQDQMDAGLRELRMKLFPSDPKLLSLARALYGLN